MKFYKVLRQRNTKGNSFHKLLDNRDYEYMMGNYSYSFAVEYNPETYNALLNDSVIFRAFKSKAIQQLFVTNQKYLAILKYNDFFNLKMVECLFVEDEKNEYLEELDELSLEGVESVIDRYRFNIKEITYMTTESKRLVVLKKNGVIGIDNGLTNSEQQNLLKFIDTLNYGLKVVEK